MAAPLRPHPARFHAYDQLAILVAVLAHDGTVLFANAALEDAVGLSWRSIEGTRFQDYFADSASLQHALSGARDNAFAALRYDAQLKRHGRPVADMLPVHVIVAQTEHPGELIAQLLPQELQARQEREERQAEQVRANKELFRNLAHEIKNPLGGIRGAAQLLEMEMAAPELSEYTQVIIREADRLQTLVDRLLAPHRHPQVLGDVNIHEVCERVRSLILAEFPQGLQVIRDYDISLPDFRGDRGQLIQALLNIVHNAAQALSARMKSTGDAQIVLRTRVARQVTVGKQRHRLALELHVIDNGPGVPDSIKNQVFLPLVSAREGGSGLGLTLAQTFVQQHLGLIELESVPGCTDFRVLIPLPGPHA